MKTQTKLFGSVASSILLVGAGAAVAAPAVAAATTDAAIAQEVAVEGAGSAQATVANVQGTFGYAQDAVTPASTISAVFSKAAAALCAGLPDYAISCACGPLHITGGVTMDATVEDLQADEAAQSVLMACACATNTAGGGAVANAKVSGVSLASVAAMAQAL